MVVCTYIVGAVVVFRLDSNWRKGDVYTPLFSNFAQPQPLDQFQQIVYQNMHVRKNGWVSSTVCFEFVKSVFLFKTCFGCFWFFYCWYVILTKYLQLRNLTETHKDLLAFAALGVRQSLESVQVNIEWMDKNYQTISDTLST